MFLLCFFTVPFLANLFFKLCYSDFFVLLTLLVTQLHILRVLLFLHCYLSLCYYLFIFLHYLYCIILFLLLFHFPLHAESRVARASAPAAPLHHTNADGER